MRKYLSYILIIVISIIFIFPFYWMFVTSVQKDVSIHNLSNLVPKEFVFDNYLKLSSFRYFWRWNFNSIFVSTMTAFLICSVSSISGYVFAKRNIPGSELLFWCFMITMAIPKQTLLVPLFMLMRDLKWMNTYASLIFPPLAWPFGIFLMKQIIKTIPNEILEAATVDGANEWQIFFLIIIPMTISGIIALFLFTFVRTYNDYFWQLLMLNKNAMRTLPLAVSTLQDEHCVNITLIMAGAVMSSLPVILIYIVLQKYFIKGITIGSIKG